MIPNQPKTTELTIFLQGSGPSDKNSTIGPHQPILYLAEELAENGVPNFRFDKKSLVNPNYYISLKEYTVQDEYHQDIQEIIRYFQNSKSYSFNKFTLIGYSLSASYIPEILHFLKDTSMKGIMIAGSPQPLSRSMNHQLQYLLEHFATGSSKSQYEHLLTLNNELLKAIENDSYQAQDEYFGVPFTYWKKDYFRNIEHDFKTLKQPILIIQGGKDYQVTMEDYEIWQKWAKEINAKNYTFKIFPEMNHILNDSKNERSLPYEYFKKGQPNQSIHKVMAEWILKN